MGKLRRERWVWAPQYLSDGTSMSPKASVSIRVFLGFSYIVVDPLLEKAPTLLAPDSIVRHFLLYALLGLLIPEYLLRANPLFSGRAYILCYWRTELNINE